MSFLSPNIVIFRKCFAWVLMPSAYMLDGGRGTEVPNDGSNFIRPRAESPEFNSNFHLFAVDSEARGFLEFCRADWLVSPCSFLSSMQLWLFSLLYSPCHSHSFLISQKFVKIICLLVHPQFHFFNVIGLFLFLRLYFHFRC